MPQIASTSLSLIGKNEHGYSFDKEAIVFIEGVVPAISTAIQAFTKEGDAVLINTPVYPPFARSVKLNRRKLIENSLIEKTDFFKLILISWKKILWSKRLNSMFCAIRTILEAVYGIVRSWKKSATSAINMGSFSFQMRSTKIWPCLAIVISALTQLTPALKTLA